MRTWKQAAALTLSVLLTVSAAFPALAVEKPADMDDATWARLQDNTLEYAEIENLCFIIILLTGRWWIPSKCSLTR